MSANAALIRRARAAEVDRGLDHMALLYAIMKDEKQIGKKIEGLVGLLDDIRKAADVLGSVDEIERLHVKAEEDSAVGHALLKEGQNAVKEAETAAAALVSGAKASIIDSKAKIRDRENALEERIKVTNNSLTKREAELDQRIHDLYNAQEVLDTDRAYVTSREEKVVEREKDVERRLALIKEAGV